MIGQQGDVRSDKARDPRQQVGIGLVVQIGPDAAEEEVRREPRRPGGLRTDDGAQLRAGRVERREVAPRPARLAAGIAQQHSPV